MASYCSLARPGNAGACIPSRTPRNTVHPMACAPILSRSFESVDAVVEFWGSDVRTERDGQRKMIGVSTTGAPPRPSRTLREGGRPHCPMPIRVIESTSEGDMNELALYPHRRTQADKCKMRLIRDQFTWQASSLDWTCMCGIWVVIKVRRDLRERKKENPSEWQYWLCDFEYARSRSACITKCSR